MYKQVLLLNLAFAARFFARSLATAARHGGGQPHAATDGEAGQDAADGGVEEAARAVVERKCACRVPESTFGAGKTRSGRWVGRIA